MNTKRIGKLATVAASAALTLQLFAGVSSAAVPNATSSGAVLGDVAGDGWAGFTTSYTFSDNNIPKLFLEIDITNGASVPVFEATRNGDAAKCATVTATVIKCEFKSVRNGDEFSITLAVKPATAADVTIIGGWSTTGYVVGGNNSHGDAWGIGGKNASGQIMSLTAEYNENGDYAAGFGNTSLTTQASTNKQSAKLTGLPSGKYASVNDDGSTTLYGGFPEVDVVVNNGDPANFQLVITYPANTKAPTAYLHISSGEQTYLECQKGAPKTNCFTWDKKAYAATLYLEHNGSLRRTS